MAPLVRWNARKTCHADLAARGVPTVPTRRGHGLSAAELRDLPAALGVDEIMVKPLVGANADDTYRLTARAASDVLAEIADRFTDREWMAQPFLRAILDEGDVSTFHFQGRFSHPSTFRMHEDAPRNFADAVEAWLG